MLGILKKSSFLLVATNSCWIPVQSWSKPKILDKMQTIKGKWRTKMNENGQRGCLFSKWLKLFVDFSSATAGFFYRALICKGPMYEKNILVWVIHGPHIQSLKEDRNPEKIKCWIIVICKDCLTCTKPPYSPYRSLGMYRLLLNPKYKNLYSGKLLGFL